MWMVIIISVIEYYPIGYIRINEKASQQPEMSAEGNYLEIKKEYLSDLNGLDKYKYIFVLYHSDKVKERSRKLYLSNSEKDVGNFAIRTSLHPNSICLSIVKLIRVKENKVFISGIDALDKSPIIDIKPYVKELDMKSDANAFPFGDVKIFNKNKVYLYTDGACSGNPGPGGYAAIIISGDHEFVVTGSDPVTTNNRMELKAVIEGLKEIPEKTEVQIISDSNYVIQGLEEWISVWKRNGWKTAGNKQVKNQDLWRELDNIIDKYKVDYVKVKGHSGDKFNERVDSLAKKEIKKYQISD